MNDDHTPIEFSWSWRTNSQLPILRFGMEVIGSNAGLPSDRYNAHGSLALIARLSEHDPAIHLQWLQHFAKKLLPEDGPARTLSEYEHPSQIFLALELHISSTLKAYIVPLERARQLKTTPIELVAQSLRTLPYGTSQLMQSFDLVRQYLETFDADGQPQTEMLAIDCIDPEKARIKIYIRSPRTSFNDVLQKLCLGGRLRRLSNSSIDALRTLWRLTLSLDDAVSDADPLPSCTHRTAGIIYHFDLRIGESLPTCKVYIPVKHYGQDDRKVAAGFQRFLESYDMKLQGKSYLEAVSEMW
jgi:DMATS type aromatic prenyltransferase